MFEREERIVFCVCVVFWYWNVTCDGTSDVCETTELVLAGYYGRGVNETTVIAKTLSTMTLTTLVGDKLISRYPWINMSDSEPERKLALSQIESLTKMAFAYPLNDSFTLFYTVSDSSSAIVLEIDSVVLTFDENLTSSMTNVDVDVDVEQFKPYVGKENFTLFLQSKEIVLKRWCNICKEVAKRDNADDANVTFLYRSDTSAFECLVDKSVPVYYALSLECDGSDMQRRIPRVSVGNMTRQAMSWKDPQCEVSTAKCVVASQNGWEKKVDVTVISTDVIGASGRAAANRVGAVVGAVVVVFVLGFVLVALFRYEGTRGPIKGIRDLVRERVGCVYLTVWARGRKKHHGTVRL